MKKGKKPIKDWDHHIDTHPEAAEFPSLLRKERTWQILRGQACYPAHPSWSLHACTWWHCGHLERFKVRPFQSRSGTRVFVGFPSGTSIKALPANAGHKRDSALILGWRRSPGAGNGNAVFLPGKSLGQRQLGRLHSMGSQRVRHDWAQIQSFYRQEEGATCRNSTDSSDGHLQVGGRWSEQHHLALWVQSGFSPRIGLPPFPRGRSWDLWQPVSRLQSTHRGVNFSTWRGGGGSPFLPKSSRDTAHSFIFSPGGGTVKGPWLMTKLFLFCLIGLLSLVLHFLTSLIKFIVWLQFFYRQKAGRGCWVGQDHSVLPMIS